MTGFRTSFRSIGGPAAVSWAAFWVSLVFNVLISFAGSLDAATSWQRIGVVVGSQAAMFAVLLLGRYTLLKDCQSRPRPLWAIACFIAAGLARSFAAGGLLAFWLGADTFRVGFRIGAGIVVGIVVFVPTAYLVASWRDYRSRRADLLARRDELTATAAELSVGIQDHDREVVDRIRRELDELLALSDPDLPLRRWSSDGLRELSHELAASKPKWQPQRSVRANVGVHDVLARTVAPAPLMPLTTVTTVAAVAILPGTAAYGLEAMAPFLAALILLGGAELWLANRIVSLMERSGPVMRAVVLVGLLAFVGLTVGAMADFLLPERDVNLWVVPVLVGLVVGFGVGFALTRAVAVELKETMEGLQQADTELAWMVARLGLIQWAQGWRRARALHGPVQGIIATAITRARESPEDRLAIFTDMRVALLESLDGRDSDLPWVPGVQRIVDSWAGFCDVAVHGAQESAGALDHDPDCRAMVLEMLTEAVSNSVRHGRATRVVATVGCSGDHVTLVITDNGDGFEQVQPGLGTRILEECTVSWSRESSPGRTHLQAVVPLAPDRHDRHGDSPLGAEGVGAPSPRH